MCKNTAGHTNRATEVGRRGNARPASRGGTPAGEVRPADGPQARCAPSRRSRPAGGAADFSRPQWFLVNAQKFLSFHFLFWVPFPSDHQALGPCFPPRQGHMSVALGLRSKELGALPEKGLVSVKERGSPSAGPGARRMRPRPSGVLSACPGVRLAQKSFSSLRTSCIRGPSEERVTDASGLQASEYGQCSRGNPVPQNQAFPVQ